MKQEYENEDEIFEKRESKIGGKITEKIKKFIVPIIIILVILIILVIEINTHYFSNIFNKSVGNTSGNITNGGYSVESGDFIYYVSPNNDMKKVNINRMEKGKIEPTVIFQGDYDVRSLNISNDKIYFVNISAESLSSGDTLDNKIYSMNLDGTEATVINDNEFSNEYLEVCVIGNKIYYVGVDNNVYSMDLKGGNRQLEVESQNGFLTVNSKYILYDKAKNGDKNYVTYIKTLGKNDERELTGSIVNIPNFYEDFIYYIDENSGISKINVNGGNSEKIYDGKAYNLNVYDGNIYFISYKDETNQDYTVCFYKVGINGGESKKVKELNYNSSFINLVNGYIYSTDVNIEESKSYISLINIDDFSETILKEWKFRE